MILNLIEKVVQMRNPNFGIQGSVNKVMLLSFFWSNLWALIRGLKWLFYGKRPRMSLLGRHVSWYNSAQISFGKYLKLGDFVYLSALGQDGIELGDNVGIGAFSRVIISTTFQQPGAFIKIGHNVGIGEYSYLGGAGGLEIGNDCIIGQYFSCHPENHIADDIITSIRFQGVTRKGIRIGANCWIGSKVTILDGVTIGDGCIVAAGAVVTSSFPSNTVIGGVPARILKTRI